MHRKAQQTSAPRPARQAQQMDAPGPRAPGAPHSAGVPNERGYQEDQPRDAEGAECCALLRPLPQAVRVPSKSSAMPRSRRGRFGHA